MVICGGLHIMKVGKDYEYHMYVRGFSVCVCARVRACVLCMRFCLYVLICFFADKFSYRTMEHEVPRGSSVGQSDVLRNERLQRSQQREGALLNCQIRLR